MRYPQHLVADSFEINTITPSYYGINIGVQHYSHETYLTKSVKKPHLKSISFSFQPMNGEIMNSKKTFHETPIGNINFIRKEKVYTKLKYSRTQSYDIVSAGVAALFAGLLGFLICEKFGFEMVDGGDFLFMFLYVIGIMFSLKLILKIYANGIIFSIILVTNSVMSGFKGIFFSIIAVFKRFFN